MATEVLVPPLGQTVDTVTLVAWYKNEGEVVVQDEPLFAIETDKATLDIESPASGVLRQVKAQAGDEVKVLSPIAIITAPDEASTGEPGSRRVFVSPRARRLAKEHDIPLAALRATGPEGAIVERDVRAYLASEAASEEKEIAPITPVARRMAEEAGLDWHGLIGSGPGGRITRDDVVKGSAQTPTAPEPLSTPTEMNETLELIPLRSVRAVIAERMHQSATNTAQVTLTVEADATALVALRGQLIQDEVSVSYNDLFLYILGRTIREHPQINVSLEGDTIKMWRRIHIGLAVDTKRGLLVPVVRDVDEKGVLQLVEETRSLAERAQNGQCAPEELSGGTFTLTNLGRYGIDAFTPLINLPECAILGVGRIKRQPVMVGEKVVGRQMVWLSLTFDHRLVDGAPAARFLQRVVQLVEGPHLLIT